MARVPYLTSDDLPEEFGHLLAERPINLRRAMANLPELADHYAKIAEWFRFEATVDPRLRELAILYVGYASASAYAFCQHVQIGGRFGLTSDDIRAVVDLVNGQPVDLPERDALVVDAARQLTRDASLDDAAWHRLERAFGRDGAMELTLAICHYNYVVRMLAALDIEVEPELAPTLDEYDPPVHVGRWR